MSFSQHDVTVSPLSVEADRFISLRYPSASICCLGTTGLHTGCDTVQGMMVGCGVDMIEIARIAEALARFGDRFCRRVYLSGEIQYCRRKRNAEESFAARFAAKEAAAKALGTGIQSGVGWRDIEVVRAPSGRPSLVFHGRAAAIARELGAVHAAISLTHTRTHALAQVFLESDPIPR